MDLEPNFEKLSLFSDRPEPSLNLFDKNLPNIDNTLVKLYDKKRSDDPKKYYESDELLYTMEKAIINSILKTSGIDNEECKQLKTKFSQIDLYKLAVRANSSYYDPKIMEIDMCLINAWIPFPLEPKYRSMKLFWDHLSKISSGGFGIIDKSNKKTASQFVIKYSKFSDLKSDQEENYKERDRDNTHELFIALHLNNLRKKIPNFVYGFGYFNCQLPLDIGDTKNSICNIGGHNKFFIYEYLRGETLTSLIGSKKLKLDEILNYYIQILFSLDAAQTIQFTHYDLHTGNIIIRPTETKDFVAIPYSLGDEQYYIITKKIATIFDFGSSYINIDGVSYGKEGLEHAGVYADRPNQMMDAYKLWMFMCYYVWESYEDPKLIESMIPLAEYFKDIKYDYNSFTEYLLKDIRNFFYLPAAKVDYSHKKLIRYIIQTYPSVKKFLKPNKPYLGFKILACEPTGDMKCLQNVDELMRNFPIYDPTGLVYSRSAGNLNPEIIAAYIEDYKKNETMMVWNKSLDTDLYILNGILEIFINDDRVEEYLEVDHKIPTKFLDNISIFLFDISNIIDKWASALIKWDVGVYNYKILNIEDDIKSANLNRVQLLSIRVKISNIYYKLLAKLNVNSIIIEDMKENYVSDIGDIENDINNYKETNAELKLNYVKQKRIELNSLVEKIKNLDSIYQLIDILGRYDKIDITFPIEKRI